MNPTKPTLAVIVVNYNGQRYLEDCFAALQHQSFKDFTTIMVDNNSTDGSVSLVRRQFPHVQVIQLKKNEGFAKPNNVGIDVALTIPSIEYIVCLNNDTIVEPDWLKYLVKSAESDETVGGVQSLSMYPDRIIQTAGIRLIKNRTFNESYPGEMSYAHGLVDEVFSWPIEIFAPSGVSALYKRAFISDVGGFDERFFAYCEDIDIGFRGRLAGWRFLLDHRSRLIHYHSATGGRASSFKAFLSKRNSLFLAIKNLPLRDLLLYFPRDMLWNMSQVFPSKRSASVSHAKENGGLLSLILIVFRAYLSIIPNLPYLISKRLAISRSTRISKAEISDLFDRFSDPQGISGATSRSIKRDGNQTLLDPTNNIDSHS